MTDSRSTATLHEELSKRLVALAQRDGVLAIRGMQSELIDIACILAKSLPSAVQASSDGDPFFIPFDCHYDGDINRCDKDCKQLGECKRRTTGKQQSAIKETTMFPKIIVNNDVVWLQLSEHDLVNLEAFADYKLSDKARIAVRKACEKARADSDGGYK